MLDQLSHLVPPYFPFFKIIVLLVGVKWCLTVVLIHVSPVAHDENLFMCFLASGVSHLEKYLFKPFAHFRIEPLLLLLGVGVLYIIRILIPYLIHDIFPYSVGCLFVLLSFEGHLAGLVH